MVKVLGGDGRDGFLEMRWNAGYVLPEGQFGEVLQAVIEILNEGGFLVEEICLSQKRCE